MKGLIERVSNPESAGESANMGVEEGEEEEQHEEHVEHEEKMEQGNCNLEEDSQMEEEESDHNEEEAEDEEDEEEEEEMVDDLLNKSLGTEADKREAEKKVKA